MSNVFVTLVLAIQIISALVMIGLILVQHGKGADMGAAFGSGGSGSLFGASGSANFLSRTTAILATVFFVSTLALTYLGSSQSRTSNSVLQSTALPASSTAAQIPGALTPASKGSAALPNSPLPASSGAGQIPTK